jgi:hypothetical protein
MKISDKNVSIKKAGTLKLLILMSLVLSTHQLLTAQNTSYDANTVGIGGTTSTAFGYHSLWANSGANNSASGIYSLTSNTSGGSNTALGTSALRLNTNGSQNTATGHDALYYNNGFGNTANGYNALFSNTIASYNTAIGGEALSNNIGSSNTATGFRSLYSNLSGAGNSAYGFDALYNNNSGIYNIAIGYNAGYQNQAGNRNIFIGNFAGSSELGSDKLYLANDYNKTILYGDITTGQVLLGNPNPTGYSFKGTRTLNVLGGILTDSMRLAPSANWADKVFHKNYPLKSLHELEKYISANKHLPGIPTASEVQSNGVNVAEMETKLLEKIEELTIYVLELKKENLQQQREINILKRKSK